MGDQKLTDLRERMYGNLFPCDEVKTTMQCFGYGIWVINCAL